MLATTCHAKVEANRCDGEPLMRRLKKMIGGQFKYMIGCSGWTPENKKDHIYIQIPNDVDIEELRFMIDHNGLSSKSTRAPAHMEKCTMVLPHGTRRVNCCTSNRTYRQRP